jgi:DNA-binding HxlR family transcriptional regulator
MAEAKTQKFSEKPSVSGMVEDVLGCKWTFTVLQLIRQGVNRPGAMKRAVDGLTTKVLNERLRKLVRYGILERIAYPEIPPRVEYRLSAFGLRFVEILQAIEVLEKES